MFSKVALGVVAPTPSFAYRSPGGVPDSATSGERVVISQPLLFRHKTEGNVMIVHLQL